VCTYHKADTVKKLSDRRETLPFNTKLVTSQLRNDFTKFGYCVQLFKFTKIGTFYIAFFKCNFTGFSTKNVLNHFTKNKLSAFYAVNKNEAQLRQNSFLKERWMPIAST